MTPTQTHQTTTPDGRVISGSSFGPLTGQPVLFIAGAATGRSMHIDPTVLAELDVRLLTMDRPGIGDSANDPERTLASTAADYRTFVDSVICTPDTALPVIANSQGSVFALALALTGAVTRLVLASPADELAHPEIHAMLLPEATALADLAQSAPDTAAEVLRGFSASAMLEMVLGGSHPQDRDFYTAEPFHTLYRRSLDEGFANDGAGYVRDTLLAMREWGLELAEIRCPVQVFFGPLDRTHSPDLGVTLTGRIPGATRTVFDDAGGALLWTHSREVLTAALAA